MTLIIWVFDGLSKMWAGIKEIKFYMRNEGIDFFYMCWSSNGDLILIYLLNLSLGNTAL
jgi:hypothetical protein